ncbi:PQQ-binding-like beta-propeller repeat protein [Maribellus maritimus]|uniref:PQQ-binding-like beta-propeller repeat protein n=1 Tax=Maribellus maritimus TaxID=2870838 RepID=UPI001EEC32B6|nr:PQQ-binding-like beta-propeller repeat protein [Maribellus maritimus]MCG6191081.1 PQQ-binding-like beta-propeller repeat protein [Maribellus maritimus]
MKIKLFLLAAFLFLNFISVDLAGQNLPGEDFWPQWRGPMATGAAIKGNPPVQFSETQNLKWKIPIPGKGHATPIVWGDKIIIETAVPKGFEGKPNSEILEDGNSWMDATETNLVLDYKVILLNLNDGKIVWEKTVASEKPEERTHKLGSWASNSPCTDGERIYAYFGSRGIYCLDFDGNILWERDFGQMEKVMSFGEGSSPYLYKNRLFIQWDHQGDSRFFALDTKTGETVWSDERDEPSSWATPLVVEINGKPQVISAATNLVRAYDFNTGEIIWSCSGLTRNVIPNPKIADGILYLSSGFRGNATMAIDIVKASGDITDTNIILWQYNQDCPYTPDNLLLGERLYFMRANNGELTCLDAKTGEVKYSKEKLEGISDLYSSPSGVGDKIYVVSENICLVIKAGDNFEILSSNQLDDDFHASPVIVGDKLILRGFNSLYCFED